MQERRCNKIPSCGSRVLNTFVFLRQRCTWPAPVIPQVFGTSVSDKSPAPGRLPALFSLRQSFRATSTEPPPRFVDSFLRPHSPSFLPLPSSSFFLPLFSFPPPSLPSLSLSLYILYPSYQRIDSWPGSGNDSSSRSIYELFCAVTRRSMTGE